MKQYLSDLQYILDHGEKVVDRTGVGTISVFGMQSRYNLRESFPAVTTKKLAWKAVVSELLWFIEGSADERRLCEILHGTRDSEKRTIWTDNAEAPYWKPKAKFSGDLGKVYGYQWRRWEKYGWRDQWNSYEKFEVDQLAQLIEGIKKDPHGRRHILSAWNVADIPQMALPPCHVLSQFHVNGRGELSCQLYQRSADMPLGVPFNIASYSLLTHMIAQVCGLKVGDFVHTIGDAHIYLNQVDSVVEQLLREPVAAPTLWINPEVTDIDKFKMSDFELVGYNPLPAIKFPFST